MPHKSIIYLFYPCGSMAVNFKIIFCTLVPGILNFVKGCFIFNTRDKNPYNTYQKIYTKINFACISKQLLILVLYPHFTVEIISLLAPDNVATMS